MRSVQDRWETYEEAFRLYENMKDEGFTVGMIEAEGYLRAMKTVVNKIKEIEDSY